MRRIRTAAAAIALILFSTASYAAEEGKPVVGVKPAYAAGLFYPVDPVELRGMIDDYLSMAPAPDPLKDAAQRVTALVVPHAGYVFSGRTAAAAYRRIQGKSYDTVILLGPYHQTYFEGASVWTAGSWRTPLGDVPVDVETAEAIRDESPSFAYDPSVHLAEHSLENQLPFLQRTLKDFKIVPILLNDASTANVEALAAAIKKHVAGKNALIVVSTDMTHYRPQAVVEARDRLTLDLIARRARLNLAMALDDGESELCGHAAVLTYLALEDSNGADASRLETVAYSTSGQATGKSESVVGYGALAAYRPGQPPAETPSTAPAFSGAPASEAPSAYSPAEKKDLLQMARRAVEDAARGFDPPPAENYDTKLDEKKAVFVTLKRKEALRGCIGRLTPVDPLYLAVRKSARLAATEDDRFQPVKPAELPEIGIEISVLGAPERVRDPDDIDFLRQGVLMKKDGRTGVFLPSVYRETRWDKTRFFGELCHQKMGLATDCWEDPATEIYAFDVDEFSE